MVNPIQFTNPQAYSGGADFSSLANLGNVYQAAQDRARQQAALGQLGDDPIANAQALTQSGVLPLAQLGIGMRDKEIARIREDMANQQAQENFAAQQRLREEEAKRAGSYLTIAEQNAKRAAEKAAEDTPEGRTAKLVAAGMDPKDPNSQVYIATGKEPPDPIRQAAEARAKTIFEQSQRYSTREGRLQAVKDGELDINDPEIRRWVALGGEIPDPAKNRLGLGTPTYTRDKEGNLRAYQLSATGVPVPVKVPEGEQVLGPGEIAQQRAEGTGTGKAVTAAKVALPDVIRNTDNLVETLNTIVAHPGKSMALGRGSHLPDWMVAGTNIGDFRTQVQRLAGEAMAQTMASLKGSGLGSVSDFEQKTMMAAFVAASTAQTEKAFNESMATALRSAEKIREIARAKAKGDFSEKPGPASAAGGAAKPDPLGLR